MRDIEKVNQSKIQALGEKEAQLLQGYMATKNCISQEVHTYALDTIASFRTFLGKTSGIHPTFLPPTAIVQQLVSFLKPSTPPDAKIRYLESFMSSVLASPFKLTEDNIATVLDVVSQSIQGKNRYVESLLAGHDESATYHSLSRDPDPNSNWLLSEFDMQKGQTGAGQFSLRQSLCRFSFDLTSNVRFTVVLSLVLWYGETYGHPMELPPQSLESFSVAHLESIVREDFGLLGLSRVGQGSLRFYLPRGEGVQGYADLGCELFFTNEWQLISIQFGDDPVITNGFTAVHVLRALSNIVCGVGVYLHLSQLHHRYNDDLLYSFYSIPDCYGHPLRSLMDPLGVGSANKNDSAILSGFQDFNTLFGNFTMQSKRANIRYHTETKSQSCTPVAWPAFVHQTLYGVDIEKMGLVQDLWIWYNAFEEFIRMALLELKIVEIDSTIMKWMDKDVSMVILRQTLTEAYFNNVIHELASSPKILQRLQNGDLCTATRLSEDFTTALPSRMQQAGATILVQATVGSTVRFHSTKNHPWSHVPLLTDAVRTFQRAIANINVSSLVHPSRVETSIAW